jgi:glycosyltransferase involved in cell wall biosynthesis
MFVSVAVPTCNRPDDLDRCLASLAKVAYPQWQIVVIDQSDGDITRQVVEAWQGRLPQLTYMWLAQKNASAARNLAIEYSSGDVLAFIDDDCTVSPDWLARVSEAFDKAPEASLILGAVRAADHDPARAFVPINDVWRERRLRGSMGTLQVSAMGANMSIRLRPGRRLLFDLLLGPGAHFRSSQDGDYAYRVLASGGTVLETPSIVVLHHGARSYASGAATLKVRDYRYGAGAVHAKLLRCGEWIMIIAIAGRLLESIAAIRPLNALRRRPTHVGGLLMFLRGLRDSFQMPVNRQEKVYVLSAQAGRVAQSDPLIRDLSLSAPRILHGRVDDR